MSTNFKLRVRSYIAPENRKFHNDPPFVWFTVDFNEVSNISAPVPVNPDNPESNEVINAIEEEGYHACVMELKSQPPTSMLILHDEQLLYEWVHEHLHEHRNAAHIPPLTVEP